MTISRRQFLSATSAAALASAAPNLVRKSHADSPIKIASILDESGNLGEWGDPMAKCMTLAVEEINAAGGIDGKSLDYIRYDTQSSNQLYAQYAVEAAVKEQVSMVHAGITSASREVVRPILGRYNTLYWYSTGYEGGVCDMNTFCSGTTPTMVVRALIDWAMPKLGKKVYVIGADYNAPQITAEFVEQYANENGGEVVAKDFYPFEVSEFGLAISKIQTAKPDMIYSMLIGAPHLSFYRQWAAAGMKNEIPIIGHFFGGGNEHVTLTPEEGDGIISVYGYWEDIESPKNRDFLKRFEKRWGRDHAYINAIAMGGYEGTMLWAMGAQKAGTAKREAVIEALRSGLTWDGPSGRITIDPQTNHTVRDVHIAQAKNRRMEVIKTVKQMNPVFTQQKCDLQKNPGTNTQYKPSF